MAPNYDPLLYWVQEREAVRIAKAKGAARPWTSDKIIGKYRFCNVRREDDRGTIWIRKNIRKPFHNHPHLWAMLAIARQINWPDTLEELIDLAWPDQKSFSPERLAKVLQARRKRGDKVYTGAYMISAPRFKGMDKQVYIAETVFGGLWDRRISFMQHFDSDRPTLQRTHEMICRSTGWGNFMAYQAVVDMRFTRLLEKAPDVDSWAAAGPGTLRGLNRIYRRPLKAPVSQGAALKEMRAIFKIVYNETGVEVDFSDIPNLLCETDKWMRVNNGEGKPRALYIPGRGA